MIIGFILIGILFVIFLSTMDINWCKIGIHTYQKHIKTDVFHYDDSMRKFSARMGSFNSRREDQVRECKCGARIIITDRY